MLAKLLAERDWLLADGATGTTLFAMGLTSGDSPELWNDLYPDRIRKLHQGFVDAGADIILTNSFGANLRRLALHDLQERTHDLNRMAASLARDVADTAGRPVVVAGSVGPTGDLFAPLGALTEADAVAVFTEQIEGLKAGGADVVWIETMSALEEIRAAATAAQKVGMPYVTTASFDTAGRTMMGILPARLAEFVAGLAPPPLAVGSNCGVGASDLLASVLAMTQANPSLVVVAKANCGIPVVKGEHVHYSGTPELMAIMPASPLTPAPASSAAAAVQAPNISPPCARPSKVTSAARAHRSTPSPPHSVPCSPRPHRQARKSARTVATARVIETNRARRLIAPYRFGTPAPFANTSAKVVVGAVMTSTAIPPATRKPNPTIIAFIHRRCCTFIASISPPESG